MPGWDNNDSTAWAGEKTEESNDIGWKDEDDEGVAFDAYANNVSKHADGNAEAGDVGVIGNGYTCRNCGEHGHFSKDCPQEKRMTGECYNCGQNCLEEGHHATECTNSRAIDLSAVPDKTIDEAWILLKEASEKEDLDDFKEATKIYSKADRSATWIDIERKLRDGNLKLFLIAKNLDVPLSFTLVDLQGKSGCSHTIHFALRDRPKRAILAEGWPESPEENMERLQDCGEAMPQVQPICRNCEQLGHTSKKCPEEKRETSQVTVTCINCGSEGHRLRDCREERKAPPGRGGGSMTCRNCGQEGHRAAECTEPPSTANVECRKCGELGHFAKDCPSGAGGGGARACHNCGEEGHMSKECDKPRNLSTMVCRNCDETGHMSRECPKPKNMDRVKCNNCGQMGHFISKCTQPPSEESLGDQGLGDTGNDGAGSFDAPGKPGGPEERWAQPISSSEGGQQPVATAGW